MGYSFKRQKRHYNYNAFTITLQLHYNAFQKILDKQNVNQKKIWVDKGSEFYNRSMKLWLEKNNTEMYSTYNEGKFVVAERFIRTLKNKIHKYMTSKSKKVYTDQ